MTTFQLTIIALSVEAILYLLLIGIALRRGSPRQSAVRALILYTFFSGLWVLSQIALRLDWLLPLAIDPGILARLPFYSLVLLAIFFLHLTRTFLRLPGVGWAWFALGIAWFAVLLLLDTNILVLPDLLEFSGGGQFGRTDLALSAAVAGWALLMIASAWLTASTYLQTELPLHRNRLKYWSLTWGITLAGGILFFTGYEVFGGDVHLLGAVVASYAALTHRLPDMRQIGRRGVSYLLVALLVVIIYVAGFMAAQYAFQGVAGYHPVWAGAALALLLAILFTPLLRAIQKLVQRLIPGAIYDPSHAVREYSLRISNIVSLERLATVAVELVRDTLKSRHGAMFVVNYHKDQEDTATYQLQPIGGAEERTLPSGALSVASPVTHRLREERRPLTQYDIDLLPEFKKSAEPERAWLASLDMDVYVPIHSQDSWIGLLALGSKLSRDRYFDEDLVLLNTLADQTAVALENARLVDDLIQLNQDLTDAYEALARANRQLQEMDKLKSAFIGVITHELRSPLANIAFSLQLFRQYGEENLTAEQRQELAQLTTNLQQARAMIDNLIAFATFLSKQGELSLAQLDFGEMLQETLPPLQSMADTKEITLSTSIPEELPPLQGDRERLSEAVHHLVHNAVKFTGAGGKVWVRCEAREAVLRLEVKDTGVGIPAEEIPSLWEGFTQMADPLQRGVEGLGLGLALVKYIVTAHGGEVWVESEEGVGSTFGFQIPLDGPERAGSPPDLGSIMG